jgi:hypothetical protein
MNAETIALARENLRKRKAEADEALDALSAAQNPSARKIAFDIVTSRLFAVTQSAHYLAATLAAEKASTAAAALNQLTNDMLFIDGLHRAARNIGALPPYLEQITLVPEFQRLRQLDPEVRKTAAKEVDYFIERLKANPTAELV